MKGYEVQVEGEYFARSGVMGSERVLKNYVVTVNLPSLERALSVVKNKLLRNALSTKYADDYITFRTQNITRITPLDDASAKALRNVPIMYMDRETLLHFIDENALPVDVELYPDLFKLREAAEQAKIDAKRFAEKQELNRASLQEDLVLAGMNPSLYPKGEPGAAVPQIKPSNPTAMKATPKEVHAKNTGDRVNGLAKDQMRSGEMGPLDKTVDDI